MDAESAFRRWCMTTLEGEIERDGTAMECKTDKVGPEGSVFLDDLFLYEHEDSSRTRGNNTEYHVSVASESEVRTMGVDAPYNSPRESTELGSGMGRVVGTGKRGVVIKSDRYNGITDEQVRDYKRLLDDVSRKVPLVREDWEDGSIQSIEGDMPEFPEWNSDRVQWTGERFE